MFCRFNGPLCVCFLFVFMSNVQVNIFQSYRDGATASWVFTSTIGSKCAMFKDMKMSSGRRTQYLRSSRFGVRCSTTLPSWRILVKLYIYTLYRKLRFLLSLRKYSFCYWFSSTGRCAEFELLTGSVVCV